MTASAQAVDRAHPPGEPAHRCVLLSPPPQSEQPTEQRPTALLRGLRARSVEVVMVADAPSVMAALAERPCDIMIVHGRIDTEEIRQLLAAARQFYPRLTLWHYGPAGDGHALELHRVTQSDEPAPAHEADQNGHESVDASAQPRHGSIEAQTPPKPPYDDEPLLSGEELRMLLGDDEWDGRPDDAESHAEGIAEDDAPSSRARGDAT
jgi:hypothetical protein